MTEAGLPSGAATRCHETARRELELGQRLSEAGDGCDAVRAELGRRLTREHRRARFGVVDHRRVDLVRVRLRLSTAAGCRRWPLRRAASSSLTPVEASRHGCRLRPYRGAIDLTVFADGVATPIDAVDLRTDGDGMVELAFSDIDAALRSSGAGSLDDYDRLEIGRDGWAGAVELERWRALAAEYHYRWVERGRGSPALFLHRHRERARAEDAHALALEARLARQEHDLALVQEGLLTPRAFIERHVWSPFRRMVERMITESTR